MTTVTMHKSAPHGDILNNLSGYIHIIFCLNFRVNKSLRVPHELLSVPRRLLGVPGGLIPGVFPQLLET